MTQEEKAKAYDEALERARALNNGEAVNIKIGTTTCEYIFPELKESEDERIRKELIDFVKSRLAGFPECGRFIAWLEKQSKHLENYDEAEKEKADFVGDGFIECHVDFLDFKEGKTYWLEYIGDDKYNVRSDTLFGKTYHITPCQLYTVFKKLTWLEKQSKHSILNVPSREVILAIWDLGNEWKELTNGCISTEYSTQLDYIQKHWEESEYYLREKQGEKPQGKSALEAVKEEKVDNQNCVKSTDKVEPKFHKGDWITIDKPCQIISMDDKGNYIAQNCDDEKTHILSKKFCESYFHLWTIQDAKDGDVLSANWRVGANFWERIIIFKKYHSKDVEGLINAPYVEGYGNTFKNGKLIPCAKVPFYSEWTDNLYPATKEQRDLLFQTMKEAGYEWDVDKKELKKIEKKLEEKLTIPSLKDFQEAFELKARQYDIELSNRGYDIHAMCKELYSLLIKPKPTWNEEDEKIRQTIINEFEQCSEWYCANGLTKEDCINWLNKQEYFEWSDEDNENVNSLFVLLDQMVSINAIGNEHSVEYKNWLKSIKERIGG